MSECQEIVCWPTNPFTYAIESGGQTFYNTRQCATAYCPDGETGDPVEMCVDAGLYSGSTQAEANAAAYAAAYTAAQTALSCSGGGGGCSNLIPQMTSPTTPLGTVYKPSNLTPPVGFEAWRAFTSAGEYRPPQFPSGADFGRYIAGVAYLLVSPKKATQFTVQLGPMNNGQNIGGGILGYAGLPAGWPGTWTDCGVFPAGGTVIGIGFNQVSTGAPIIVPCLTPAVAYGFYVFALTVGTDPFDPIAVKGLQICGTS